MFEKFSNLAKDALKAGADYAAANPDKLKDLVKSGAELVSGSNGENKGIIENAKDNLKEKSVNLIQEALNNISPLKIDIEGSITEKSVVIHEDSMNSYLKEKILDIPGLERLNIQIWNDNLLLITGEATKSLLKVSFSQKLKLEKFTLNNEEGMVEFSLIGEPDVKAKGFIRQIALFISRMILKSVVNKNLIEVMNENNVQLKENKLFIDLKTGLAKQFYQNNINQVSGKNIPLIGEKKIIELISIKEVITKDKKILVGLGF